MPLPHIPAKFNVPIAFAAGIALMFGMQAGTSQLEGQVVQTTAEPNKIVEDLLKQQAELQQQLQKQQLKQEHLQRQLRDQYEEQKETKTSSKKKSSKKKTSTKSTKKKSSSNKAQLLSDDECRTNDECVGVTTVCNAQNRCQQLKAVHCTCSQENVLQCADPTERAKHTFCPKGCEERYSELTKQVEARCK